MPCSAEHGIYDFSPSSGVDFTTSGVGSKPSAMYTNESLNSFPEQVVELRRDTGLASSESDTGALHLSIPSLVDCSNIVEELRNYYPSIDLSILSLLERIPALPSQTVSDPATIATSRSTHTKMGQRKDSTSSMLHPTIQALNSDSDSSPYDSFENPAYSLSEEGKRSPQRISSLALHPTDSRRIRSSIKGPNIEISPMNRDLHGYWDSSRQGFFRGMPPSRTSNITLLTFSKDQYVRVFLDGREFFPDSAGGRTWLKGQVFAMGNCQGPRGFQFFHETDERGGDDHHPSSNSINSRDPFTKPVLIRMHLAKCPSHRGYTTLSDLCRLQLEIKTERKNRSKHLRD